MTVTLASFLRRLLGRQFEPMDRILVLEVVFCPLAIAARDAAVGGFPGEPFVTMYGQYLLVVRQDCVGIRPRPDKALIRMPASPDPHARGEVCDRNLTFCPSGSRSEFDSGFWTV
jgi:hypothetical protein